MASASTSFGGLTFVRNGPYSVSNKERRNKETGSPFDATTVSEGRKLVEHTVYSDRPIDGSAFSPHIITVKRDPKADRLRARAGMGGTLRRTEAAGPRRAPVAAAAAPKLRSTSRRVNPPNTYFRKLFERGDLPIRVKHTSAGIRAEWLKPIDKLDLHEFLPVFMSGMREIEEPYMSLAQHGTQDLLDTGGDRVLPVVPQLIEPMREALVTRDPEIVSRVLAILQKLATCGELVGEALVPFFRRLLPVLSIFKTRHHNIGDRIDYGQRFKRNIGELIEETLQTLELHGGPDAFINLRYCIPTYESAVLAV